MKSEAAVLREKAGAFQIEPITLDKLRDDELIVKIIAAGICHTDISVRDGFIPMPETPSILGHEGAGIVVESGKGVKDIKIGDRVALSFAYCGDCSCCQTNRPARCENFFGANVGGRRLDGSCTAFDTDGAPLNAHFFGQSSFATYAIVKHSFAVPIEDDIPFHIAAPLGCGFQTGAGTVLNAMKPSAGNSILVLGVGAVGLAAVMAANVSECNEIIVADLNDHRLKTALTIGATHAINVKTAPVVEQVKDILPNGVDFVIEASGAPAAMESAFYCVRPYGKVSFVGAPKIGSNITIDANALMMGASYQAVVEGDSDPRAFIPKLIDYYRAGKMPFDKLIKTYPFQDVNTAFADSESGKVIKSVLQMPE